MKRVLSLVLLGLATAAAADETATATLAERCAACHGAGGAKPIVPEYPIIAGQHGDYLEHALNEYREGKRKNAVMVQQAKLLSKDEIAALARYFERQPTTLYTPAIR